MKRRDILKLSTVGLGANMAPSAMAVTKALDSMPFGQVLSYFQAAEEAAVELGFDSPDLKAAYLRQVLMILAGSYIAVFGSDIATPELVPYISSFAPYLAPNSDTFYGIAPVDPDGVYRVSGRMGTETLAGITLRDGGPHLGKLSGKRVGEIDFTDVRSDDEGLFSFLLSKTRPKDSGEQWFLLPEKARCIMSRRVIKDSSQVDGAWDLERIDRLTVSLRTSATIEHKIDMVLNCAQITNRFVMEYMNKLKQKGANNQFIQEDQKAYGGLVSQVYFFSLFDLEEGEALILESDVPDAKYWSVQVIDPFATSLDFVNHQTFMNDSQVMRDADGRVRLVLSVEDLGVGNWLDTQGWRQGGLIWRWNGISKVPSPKILRVKEREIKKHLPQSTVWVNEGHRQKALALRGQFYKNRRLF